MNREVGSHDEDNSEAARFTGDDVGLPESPLYSNFSQHLWTTHARLGGVQTSDRFRASTDAPTRTAAGRHGTRRQSRPVPGLMHVEAGGS